MSGSARPKRDMAGWVYAELSHEELPTLSGAYSNKHDTYFVAMLRLLRFRGYCLASTRYNETNGGYSGGNVTSRNWPGQGEFQLMLSLSPSLTSYLQAVACTFIPTLKTVPR